MTTLSEIARPVIAQPLPREVELANRLTHGLGLVLSVVGAAYMMRAGALYGDTMQRIGLAVYGVTLVALYAASTLSHSFEHPRLRHAFRTLDQVCIFLLIAGTFTPIALTYLRDGWWWALFVAVWTLALAGICAKLFFTRHENVAIWFYVFVGWLPVLGIKPIVAIMPPGALMWLLLGGLFYTAGTLFLMRDERVPFFHAVWHIFVIVGSACHYYAVICFVVPLSA